MEQLESTSESTTVKKLKEMDSKFEYKEFELALRTQIRFLTLQSIDTLFELIFNLMPDTKPVTYYDDRIVEQLLRKKSFTKDIETISKESERIKWFDSELDKNYTIGMHLFYFGSKEGEIHDLGERELANSLKNIQKALIILAQEIPTKSELNAFKHGERAFPYIAGMIFTNSDHSNMVRVDLENNITFFDRSLENKNQMSIRIKETNSMSDFGKLILTTKLIENIILLRRHVFTKKNTPTEINFLTDAELERLTK